MKKGLRILFSMIAGITLLVGTGFSSGLSDKDEKFSLTRQVRNDEGLIRVDTINIKGSQIAIVVMDMWDTHWCKSFTDKTGEMVEPMNRTLNAARQLGISIVFSPSDVASYYDGQPQREIMKTIPNHVLPESEFNPPQALWNKTGGCECSPERPCKSYRAWTHQHEDLKIEAGDYITENTQELYNFCKEKGITTILYMGVASNMCVLNRPTGLIAMERAGIKGIVVRDLSKAITGNGYDPDTKTIDPDFTPEYGSEQVMAHIERHIAPTISANQLFIAANINDDIYKREYGKPLFTKEEVKNYVPKGATQCFRHLCYDYNWPGRTLSDLPKKFTKADPVAYAEFSKRVNLDAALVLSVSHPGYTTYDSEYGVRFPGLKYDWFGEVVKELHKRDISAFGYVTVGANWKYMREHIGKPYINTPLREAGDISREGLCLNSEYLNLVTDYSREVLENYPVDALRYDMFYTPKECICDGCKQHYKEVYNEEFTSWEEIIKKHPKRQDFFNLETLNRAAKLITTACRETKPSVEIWQNCINTYHYANINLGRMYDVAYIEFGEPFRLLAVRGILDKNAIIVGQTLRSPIRRLMMALGARCYQYEKVDQETVLPVPESLDWFNNDLAPFFKMVSEVQPYLEEATIPSDIGIVYSERTRYHFKGLIRKDYVDACKDMTLNYLDSSIPVRFINCLDLNVKDLSKYKVLLLTRASGLTPEELGYLKEYVKEGGNLIITGDALMYDERGEPRANFSLSQEMGLRYEKTISDNNSAELKFNNPLYNEDLKIGLVQTTPTSGNTLMQTKYKGKDFPLVHVNNYGSGKIAYVALSASSHIIRQVGNMLTGDMSIIVSDSDKQVILAQQEKQNRYVLHLIDDGWYSITIDKDFAEFENVIKQYPAEGWNYSIEKTDNGIKITVGGDAKDRLLVLE